MPGSMRYRCGGSRSVGLGQIKRLVIYLDNGPKNSGRRTQFEADGAVRRLVGIGDHLVTIAYHEDNR